METVLERFLRYVKVDTQSQEDVERVPSTEKQFDLANMLVEELKAMGAHNVRLTENCYIYAEIPATTEEKWASLGFISHMDTSDAVSGKDVNPQIIKNYDGKTVVINKKMALTMGPEEYPDLLTRVGEDLIVTDGNTLLGADDKAGVAEIMTMAEYLLEHREIRHGKIMIGFTPDEEVGRGADFFDVREFGADFAYTVDGGPVGEIEYENFNAAALTVTVTGKSVHPGSAKNVMKNALTLGMKYDSLLPENEVPEFTEGYEGFHHLTNMEGNVDKAVMHYILRDHDEEKLEEKKRVAIETGEYLNKIYGPGTFAVEIKDQYCNMKKKIEPYMFLIDNVKDVMTELGITPRVSAIRGGTDGARLSFMGLPCPNLCTGGANYHGRFEYVTVQSMEKCVDILIRLASKKITK
ncbi:MAG: peptidase T [Lachnospiraceae bacterium]|nr:peptidase T [Lachnospiraceae bacterium]